MDTHPCNAPSERDVATTALCGRYANGVVLAVCWRRADGCSQAGSTSMLCMCMHVHAHAYACCTLVKLHVGRLLTRAIGGIASATLVRAVERNGSREVVRIARARHLNLALGQVVRVAVGASFGHTAGPSPVLLTPCGAREPRRRRRRRGGEVLLQESFAEGGEARLVGRAEHGKVMRRARVAIRPLDLKRRPRVGLHVWRGGVGALAAWLDRGGTRRAAARAVDPVVAVRYLRDYPEQ